MRKLFVFFLLVACVNLLSCGAAGEETVVPDAKQDAVQSSESGSPQEAPVVPPAPTPEPEKPAPVPTPEPEKPAPVPAPEPEKPTPVPAPEPEKPTSAAVNTTPKSIRLRDVEVSWSSAETTLKIGQTTRLDVLFTPETAYSGIAWKSSDSAVAVVDEWGFVSAVGSGKCSVTAETWNGKKASIQIVVDGGYPQLTYALTADGQGYEITGCETDAYAACIPAACQGLPVVGIRPGAFMECQNLRYFVVESGQTGLYAEDGVLFSDVPEKTLVCFPPAYDRSGCYYVPDGTVAVAPYGFAGMNSLKTLTLPDGMRVLGDAAFAQAHEQPKIFVPDSVTEVGSSLMEQQYGNAVFCGNRDSAVAAWAEANNIPFAGIVQWEPAEQTAAGGIAAAAQREGLTPFAGKVVTVPQNKPRHIGWYDELSVEQFYDLTTYQQGFDGEVRLAIETQWGEMLPDKNGATQVESPVQTGLYGAGYTEGKAILRGYDLQGKLVCSQSIEGDFAFSFDGASSLGIEGGRNTKLSVIPLEPVFLQTAGVVPFTPDTWYPLPDGNRKQWFILQYPNASCSFDMPDYLNLSLYFHCDSTTDRDPLKNSHYLLVSVWTQDETRTDEMNVCSIVFDGMNVLMDSDELYCIVNRDFNVADTFAEDALRCWRAVKDTMIGNYFPTTAPVNKLTIKGDGSYPNADWNSFIYLDEQSTSADGRLTLIHEMVHALDASIPTVRLIPPGAWQEGRAEYLSYLVCDRLGIDYHDSYGDAADFDWSFLSESEKADFFRYYYFSANRRTEYSVGLFFLRYLNETYGEDVSEKILANIAAATGYEDRQRTEANALIFKQCVESATEAGVFQNFVRDVIEKP